jgi:hypothetical protein
MSATKSFALVFLLGIHFASFGQLLYSIQGKPGTPPSYLYGTIHLMPKKDFKIQPRLQQAFDSCLTLAMEVDLNLSLSDKIKMAQETLLPGGKTLKDVMTPEEYKRLVSYCKDSLDYSDKKFERYAHLKPFYFSSLLLQKEMKKTKSYEMEFNNMAKKKQKKTLGLESIQAQLQTINTVSIEDQVDMLMDELGQPMLFDEMLQSYLAEDLDKLYGLITKESASFPDFTENLLNKRNRNWIPVIEEQIKSQPTFIAVGAGHLPGDSGVINLLKQKGYQVTPISMKAP